MASVINRSLHPDALWPGVKGWFGLTYDNYDKVWTKLFTKIKGQLQTDRFIEATGFGMFPIKTEGAPTTYDSDQEGYKTLVTPYVISSGYQVTREELEDNQYEYVSRNRMSSLAFALNNTLENSHANIFLNAFNSAFPIGDGTTLCSNAHPTKSGLQSNLPLINADFSEDSLEDMIQQIVLAENARGLRINLQPKQLVMSTGDMFNAERVLQSELRSGSANNDINAVKSMGLIPGGVVVNPFFGMEQTGAWFLQTNIPEGKGFISDWRREPELERSDDFDTMNAKVRLTARYEQAVIDWRAVWGTQGV